MWLPLSTVTALCVLLEVAVDVTYGSVADDALEVTFSERTRADWEKVWHQESHSRCREKLIRHLYWACEKDIYRIARRNDVEKRGRTEVSPLDGVPWTISGEAAHGFLRIRRTGKRRSGGSITAECCTRIGCTWEEYAEYCPSNKRLNHYRRRK